SFSSSSGVGETRRQRAESSTAAHGMRCRRDEAETRASSPQPQRRGKRRQVRSYREAPGMNRSYTAVITRPVSRDQDPRGFRVYGHLSVIATSEDEARALVEQHIAERKPLGFSEREIRKENPKRTPWVPGLRVFYLIGGEPDRNGCPFGV